MKEIKIFLASSNELKEEREQFEIQISRKNNSWGKAKGIILRLIKWEGMSSKMSKTGSQSEYNKVVQDADLFVLLAHTKVGEYTEQEFDNAFEKFEATKKPLIFTYFKKLKEKADDSLVEFQDKLSGLNHFYAQFDGFHNLWNEFNKELDGLELDDFGQNIRPKDGYHKVFNKIFITEMVSRFKRDSRLPDILSFVEKENWASNPQFLQDSLSFFAKRFIYVIGDELRRLYYIGNDKKISESDKFDHYLKRSVRIYRTSLQLLNYVFISKLWDEKIKHPEIKTDGIYLQKFFQTKYLLGLDELRLLLQELLAVFKSNSKIVQYPLEDEHLDNLNEFLDNNSELVSASMEIEKLASIDREKEEYTESHHDSCERSLGIILSSFSFLLRYKLLSVRKIEYFEARNSEPKYYKDINLIKLPLFESDEELKNTQMENLLDQLKYDPEKPQLTNSIFFNGRSKSINLFPFLIDYNALIDAVDFQLYYYDCLSDNTGMRFFCPKEEKKEIVQHVEAAPLSKDELRNEVLMKKFKEDTCKELVTTKFAEAMKTLIGVDFVFETERMYKSEDEEILM